MPKRQGKTTFDAFLQSSRGTRSFRRLCGRVVLLQPIGQFYRKIGAFANLARGAIILIKGQPHCLNRLKEPVEVLREELAAKTGSVRARKFILGNGGRSLRNGSLNGAEILLTSVCRKVTGV